MAKVIKIVSKHGNFDLIVDDEDFDRVNEHKWHVSSYRNNKLKFRAAGSIKILDKRTSILMHRFIMNVINSNVHIDHINGNGLDNRKCNLRLCTNAENSRNRKSHRDTSCSYKGVSWCKSQNKWRVNICFNYKVIYIGRFKTKEEAALAYNKKALELFGEFAYLNIIEPEK